MDNLTFFGGSNWEHVDWPTIEQKKPHTTRLIITELSKLAELVPSDEPFTDGEQGGQ